MNTSVQNYSCKWVCKYGILLLLLICVFSIQVAFFFNFFNEFDTPIDYEFLHQTMTFSPLPTHRPFEQSVAIIYTALRYMSLDEIRTRPPIGNIATMLCQRTKLHGKFVLYLVHHDVSSSDNEQSVIFTADYCGQSEIHVKYFNSNQKDKDMLMVVNDAIIDAYLNGCEFFIETHGDMMDAMTLQDLSERLQKSPQGMLVSHHHPSSPKFYSFSHVRHLELFGFVYPPKVTKEQLGTWLQGVYENKALNAETKDKVLYERIKQDRLFLEHYYELKKQNEAVKVDPKKIISMSLYGNENKYLWGAIRNVHLKPLYFPTYTVRFYVEFFEDPIYPTVPPEVLHKLEALGAQVVYIPAKKMHLAPMFWRFLAAGDLSLDHFIVRDSDSRFSVRDAVVVADWLKSKKPFHCVRDHPSHSNSVISGGMWGAKPGELHNYPSISWQEMTSYRHHYLADMNFLAKMWKVLTKNDLAYCHDSFSCEKYAAVPFPVKRVGSEHIGQRWNEYGEPNPDDLEIMNKAQIQPKCGP